MKIINEESEAPRALINIDNRYEEEYEYEYEYVDATPK